MNFPKEFQNCVIMTSFCYANNLADVCTLYAVRSTYDFIEHNDGYKIQKLTWHVMKHTIQKFNSLNVIIINDALSSVNCILKALHTLVILGYSYI